MREEIKKRSVKKICVILGSGIGDKVVSLKITRALTEIFDEVYVPLPEDQTFLLENENKIKVVKEKRISNRPVSSKGTVFNGFLSFFYHTKDYFQLFFRKKYEYDLLIDFGGFLPKTINYSSKYSIGPNRGFFSIFYTDFYKDGFSTSGKHIVESYKEMIKECLGINVFIDDKPPKNYKEKKYEKIFIFVGKRTEKNLSYEKWKEIIVELARIKPCVVADDHEQKIMEKLKEDGDIKNNDNIELIVGKRSLEELAEIANNSKLFIAVDGGGEHYLERYTNSITIYTCGLPLQWKPYSLNSYEKFKLKDEHVMEKTINSKGLKKYIIYRIEKRRPCLGLCCDYEEFKNIDVSIIVDVVKEILVA